LDENNKLIYLVEGKIDKAIIEQIIERANISPRFQMSVGRGKNTMRADIPVYLNAVIKGTTGRILITEDLDDSNEKQIMQSYASILGVENKNIDPIKKTISIDDNMLFFYFSGLPGQKIGNAYTIKRAMIEDHLVKLLFEDDISVKSLSRTNKIIDCSTLIHKIDTCNKTMKQHDLEIMNSKQLLELVKVIIKLPVSLETMAGIILKNADEKLISSNFSELISFLRGFESS